MPSRLALGTVQFGMPYGIANYAGQVKPSEVASILEIARHAGIDTLDTAIAYGESERCLGELGVSDFRIVTKLPALPDQFENAARWVTSQVEASLQRLKVTSLYGLLFHHPADLLGPHGAALSDALTQLRQNGIVTKTGYSAYRPDDVPELQSRHAATLVQMPLNLFDRRLVSSGCLSRFKENGVEVHTRSAFLQGLLLMPAAKRPAYFDRWRGSFDRFQKWLEATAQTALEACIGFIVQQPAVDRIVVGVDNAAQLQQIVAAAQRATDSYPHDLEITDEELISPALWRIE